MMPTPNPPRSIRLAAAAAALTAAAAFAPSAPAQTCVLDWDEVAGGVTATSGPARVNALLVHDDGSGPALYLGGLFTHAGGVPASNLARFDGTTYSAVGAGTDGEVYSFVEHDGDGAGPNPPQLFLGGTFANAGGVAASNVACWNGTTFVPLGLGTNGLVEALASFDPDGAGPGTPELFVGGGFTLSGGAQSFFIARWNGAAWSPLGSGTNSNVRALAVHDDGSGEALYVGGGFFAAGGSAVTMIARWDSSGWSTFGGPLSAGAAPFPNVWALHVFPTGGGQALAVGGNISTANGVSVKNVACWDGSSWLAMGDGLHNGFGFGSVTALGTYDDGTGAALFAGGFFSTSAGRPLSNLARYDGANGWVSPDAVVDSTVKDLVAYDAGSGSELYAGGLFTAAGSPGKGLISGSIALLAPTGYCQAKVNSQGCTPILSTTGTPSLSAGSGFVLTASNVLNNTAGTLVYSLGGQTMLPFRGGTLCLRPPLVRVGFDVSGGSPSGVDCTGTLSFDFNTFLASGLDPALVCGRRVNVQCFSRDGGFAAPNNVGMTAGCKFTVQP